MSQDRLIWTVSKSVFASTDWEDCFSSWSSSATLCVSHLHHNITSGRASLFVKAAVQDFRVDLLLSQTGDMRTYCAIIFGASPPFSIHRQIDGKLTWWLRHKGPSRANRAFHGPSSTPSSNTGSPINSLFHLLPFSGCLELLEGKTIRSCTHTKARCP